MNIHIDIDPDFRCMICNRQQFDYLELVDLIECTFCMECYSPARAKRIPYDEMRRILNLPDVGDYIARREAEIAWERMMSVFSGVGESIVLAYKELEKSIEPFKQFAAAFGRKSKHVPPMWAVDPAHSRRTRNREADIRTPYR
ncbi:hypothetical protein ACU5JM_19635 [Rhodococcus erythropolis]|uniref:hypothetical protein n=1 Tax=Rhodococcus erythropolis TaxID=1833 RepID=UPI00406BBCCE